MTPWSPSHQQRAREMPALFQHTPSSTSQSLFHFHTAQTSSRLMEGNLWVGAGVVGTPSLPSLSHWGAWEALGRSIPLAVPSSCRPLGSYFPYQLFIQILGVLRQALSKYGSLKLQPNGGMLAKRGKIRMCKELPSWHFIPFMSERNGALALRAGASQECFDLSKHSDKGLMQPPLAPRPGIGCWHGPSPGLAI